MCNSESCQVSQVWLLFTLSGNLGNQFTLTVSVILYNDGVITGQFYSYCHRMMQNDKFTSNFFKITNLNNINSQGERITNKHSSPVPH